MGLRELLSKRSRDARWLAAALGVILFAAIFVYYLIQRGRELPSTLVTNKVLLFALKGDGMDFIRQADDQGLLANTTVAFLGLSEVDVGVFRGLLQYMFV